MTTGPSSYFDLYVTVFTVARSDSLPHECRSGGFQPSHWKLNAALRFECGTALACRPTDPDAPNDVVLPHHIAMPIGAAVVEGQVEFVRQPGKPVRIETDARTQRVQIFYGAVLHALHILNQNLGRLRNLRSW
jgi:hypothetical protein